MYATALMHAVVFGNVTAIIQRIYSRRSIVVSNKVAGPEGLLRLAPNPRRTETANARLFSDDMVPEPRYRH